MSDRPALYAHAVSYLDQLVILADRPTIDRDLMVVMVELVGMWLETLREGEASLVLPPCPALERWRRQTLEDRAADPIAKAGAWELTAVQCEQSDARDLAVKCRANAVYALRPRRVA